MPQLLSQLSQTSAATIKVSFILVNFDCPCKLEFGQELQFSVAYPPSMAGLNIPHPCSWQDRPPFTEPLGKWPTQRRPHHFFPAWFLQNVFRGDQAVQLHTGQAKAGPRASDSRRIGPKYIGTSGRVTGTISSTIDSTSKSNQLTQKNRVVGIKVTSTRGNQWLGYALHGGGGVRQPSLRTRLTSVRFCGGSATSRTRMTMALGG